MKIKYKKNNYKERIAFFALLAMWHRFFYLLPFGIGSFDRDDLTFLYCIILFVTWFLSSHRLFKGRYIGVIIGAFGLIFISALLANINVSQTFLRGLINQMSWSAVLLTYFPLVKWIQDGKLTQSEIVETVVVAALVEVVLLFLQVYIVGTSSMFLHIKTSERYQSTRIYLNTAYILISLAFVCRKIAGGEKVIKNTILMLILVFPVVFIIKSRIGMVIALAIIIITMLFGGSERFRKNNNGGEKEWLMPVSTFLFRGVMVGSIVLITIFGFQLQLVQDLISAARDPLTDLSFTVRLNAIDYYLIKWRSSLLTLIFGYGYNTTEAGLYGYIVQDNGIFAFVYLYGGVGLLWVCGLAYRTIKDSISILRADRNAMFLALSIANFIGLSVTYYSGYYFVYTILIIILIEANRIEKMEIRGI